MIRRVYNDELSGKSSTGDYVSSRARLAAVRKKEKLTQVEFAGRLGVTSRSYLNYENGVREAPAHVLFRLVREFDVDADWVLGGSDDVPRRAGNARPDEQKLKSAIVDILQAARSQEILAPSERIAEAIVIHYFSMLDVDDQHERARRIARLAA